MTETTITNKLEIRLAEGVTPEQIAAALTTPPAPEKRLTGADVTVHIFKDDVLQNGLALIRDFVVTFAASSGSEAMHAMIEFTAHMEGVAYLDFIEDVTSDAAFSIGASVAPPTGGARTLMLKDVEFAVIKVSVSGSRDFVEARFTAVSESYAFLR